MLNIPRDEKLDSTLALLSEGYEFIRKRCAHHQSDFFSTRLMMRPVVCALGEDAARMFYHPDRFTREAAMPPTTLMSLQDKGSVQLQQGVAHAQRKRLFMGLMSSKNIEALSGLMETEWRRRLGEWESREQVELHSEFRQILSRAVCQWAGIPLNEGEAQQRSHELGAMIDGAGTLGPKNWLGLLLRTRTERWAQGIIKSVRDHQLRVTSDSPVYLFAWYRENGNFLSEKIAGVELLNLLRPTVAIARYLTFATLALHDYPECRVRLRSGGEQYLHYFVQEVRRYYPFFTFIGGRAREAFDWRGHHFPKHTWVLLDLYGTNHDERQWHNPDSFIPERFRDWNHSAFNLIPQGGGEFDKGHRCPGEWSTIDLLKSGVRMLVREMDYQVPQQDLGIDLSKVPALPQGGLFINKVRAVKEISPRPSAKICPFPQGGRAPRSRHPR